ncbi:response regulator [Cellulosimicrobium cellulans]|jgi:CheY-like chemotaxis protein|uniref:Response regulator n=1 Tax=Cellulosimicrobium cellulans TaxID=1710 RepID=A0A4Y4E2I7_CELCE|nr:response regulator [Cellulosimicrobium cellulans]GED10244.1 response regulator [Cellulosimicrobium cellulans]
MSEEGEVRRRVVVIDDDPSIREVVELALRVVGGYEVHVAADGEEGTALAERVGADAILLDVMMPVVDGPTVLAELRARPSLRDVPVVFLTAKVGAGEISRLDGLGAAGVITKPFDVLDLGPRLGALLGWNP